MVVDAWRRRNGPKGTTRCLVPGPDPGSVSSRLLKRPTSTPRRPATATIAHRTRPNPGCGAGSAPDRDHRQQSRVGVFDQLDLVVERAGAGELRAEQHDHAREVQEDEERDAGRERPERRVVAGDVRRVPGEPEAQHASTGSWPTIAPGSTSPHVTRPVRDDAVDDQKREEDEQDRHDQADEPDARSRDRQPRRGAGSAAAAGCRSRSRSTNDASARRPVSAHQRQADELLLAGTTAGAWRERAARSPFDERREDAERAPDQEREADERDACPATRSRVDHARRPSRHRAACPHDRARRRTRAPVPRRGSTRRPRRRGP